MKTLQKNQTLELSIESLTSEGVGVARHGGFVIFVSGALPGEVVSAKLIKVKKNYAVARLQAIHTPAQARRTPPCPYFPQCGGCTLQHMQYDAQLAFKQQLIHDCLTRIGKQDIRTEPVAPSEEFHYRNKASFPVGQDGGRITAGPFARRSHRIIDCEACRIQPAAFASVVGRLRKLFSAYDIPAYDERTGAGSVRHIVLREAGGRMLLTIVCAGRPARIDKLAAEVYAEFGLAGVVLNLNPERTNVVLGNTYETLCGQGELVETLCGLKYYVAPATFLQVNHAQCETLYTCALEWAGCKQTDIVVDAYCGMGSMSLLFARKVQQVYGIECVGQAVADARRNAQRNGIYNAEFQAANAEDALPALLANGVTPSLLLLDPPRKGCDARLLEAAVAANIERIVYVSCNPATLARDVEILCSGGYKLLRAKGFDMFPQTEHVETAALLTKVD